MFCLRRCASVEDSRHHQRESATLNGNVAGHAASLTPIRYATEKQILCIQGLARKNGIPIPGLLKQAGVPVFNDMTVRQPSQMIESLKGSSAN